MDSGFDRDMACIRYLDGYGDENIVWVDNADALECVTPSDLGQLLKDMGKIPRGMPVWEADASITVRHYHHG